MTSKFLNKNNIVNILVFFAILIVATVVRFACIDKASGLWYDELVMYNHAVQANLNDVILCALSEDVHLPLYQVLLHCWAKLFSFSDFSLRSFSAIFGIFTVIFGFFIGKTLKSNLVGFFTMGIFAINSFLIYYSQEVRMYELLAMFSTLNLLCLAKIYKDNSKKLWYLFWIISASGLILTYTIAILYVAIQVLFFLVLRRKDFLIPTIILTILNLPVIWYLLVFKDKFANFITGFYSDWSSLFVVIQNFFTPKLVGLGTNPPHYIGEFISKFSFADFVFVIIPIIIALYCIFVSVKNSKFARFTVLISLSFLLIEILAFVFTDFKILSRYVILILPNFLVLMSLAISENKNKLTISLISLFLVLNFSYLCVSQNSAFRLQRVGYLPLAKLLEQNNINDNDVVVVWNRKEVLMKYLDKKLFVFSILKDFAYKSEFMFELEDELNKVDENGKKELLRDYFKSKIVPMNTLYLTQYLVTGMHKDQKLMIVVSDYFDNFDQNEFLKIVNNDKDYKNISYNNLITLKSLLDLRFICDKNLKYKEKTQAESFVVYVYEK